MDKELQETVRQALAEDIGVGDISSSLLGNDYISESKFTYSREITYHDWFSTRTQNYIRNRDNKQKKSNKIMLPSYFNNFGVLSSLESFIRSKANAEKRIKNESEKLK